MKNEIKIDSIFLINFLRNVPLFNKLKKNNLKTIMEISKIRKIPAYRFIIKKNEKSYNLFIIIHGSVEIQEQNEEGKIKVLAVLGQHDCFGEMGFLTNRVRSASVKTLKETTLLEVSKRKFFKLLVNNSDFMLNVVKILSERIVNTNNQIQTLVFKNLQGRVASALLRLTERYGIKTETGGLKIDFPVKHSFIAELTGSSRETITKILTQFKNEGSIQIDNKYITIIDKKKLLSWG